MITLTTPPTINATIGGNNNVAYGKLVLAPITLDVLAQTVSGNIVVSSTSQPSMTPVTGTFQFRLGTSELLIQVSALDIIRRIQLTGPQVVAIQNQIEAAQAQFENGLIALGVVDGVRTPGA